jgi:hypothetical protein
VNRLAIAPCRHDRGLVDQVGEVGSGEARRQPGDLVEIKICGKLHLSDVHFQDFATASAVRAVNQHLSVKPSRTQQCGIEHLWAIGGSDQDYAGAGIKAIQLGEKLIKRLLLFIIAAERARHAAAPQGVQFVNEDNAGRRSSGLFEQISDPRSAHPDEHLDEFRARYGEEGNSGLAGDCSRQESLSGARRPDQQNAFGDTRAQATERFRIAQERDHFLEFGFRFVNAGHIAECHFGIGFDIDFGARFPD